MNQAVQERTAVAERTVWARLLVVGASGQVGTALLAALQEGRGGDIAWRATSRTPHGMAGGLQAERLDLGELASVSQVEALLGDWVPDLVLCPGAMTYVDGCEAEPALAWRVNARGPAVLAAYTYRRRLPFVYFSSDYVFDGSDPGKGPYTELDEPAPLNVYGRTKLEGEAAVMEAHPGALVVRTSWVYGPDPGGKNFITALRRQLEAGTPVRVPRDQISTPTLNGDLARRTLELVGTGAHGVVHVCGSERMSRYELACRVARFFGLKESLIEGVETADLHQRAQRPLHSGLRSVRLGQWLPGARMHSLNEGLTLMQDLPSS